MIFNTLKYKISRGKYVPKLTSQEIEKLPENNEIKYFFKGLVLSESGSNQKAIDYFEESVDINPKFKHAWFEMGLSYALIGNDLKAIECNEKVVEIDPKFKDAWNILGDIY